MKIITGTSSLYEDVRVQQFVPFGGCKPVMAKQGLTAAQQKNQNIDLFINCMRLKDVVR